MGLGRGLASLISGRNSDVSPDDVLERIDSMELEEAEVAAPAKPNVTLISVGDDVAEEELALADEGTDVPVAQEARGIPVVEEAEDEDPVEAVEEEIAEVEEVKAEELAQEEAAEDEEEEQEAQEVATDIEEEATPEPIAEPEPEEEKEIPAVPEAEERIEEIRREANERVEETDELTGDLWDQHEGSVQQIPIGDITINPLQPRRSFSPRELEDLQESIAQNGILQPLVVRRLENGAYELIAGERRLRAATALKWDKVPCVVRRDVKSDQSRLVYALIENVQRENLNPIEEALAYDQLNKDFGLTHEEIGERVGKSRVGITNIVRVLQLPAEIQRGMIEGKITMGHAKAILMIPDPEKQIRFYHHLVDEGLTVRKAEVRARRIQRAMNITDPKRMIHRNKKDPIALKYGPPLEDRYGYHATVRYGEGLHVFEVVFRATSEAELDELTGRLLGTRELPGQDLEKDLIGE